MPTARAPQQRSGAPLLVAVSVPAAVAAYWHHLPAVAAIWATLLVAAWTEGPPQLTGPRAAGRPTPADRRERSRLRAFQVWTAARTTLLNPLDWAPGRRPLGVTVPAATLAALAWSLPVTWPTPLWGRAIDAATAFVTVLGLAAARRRVTGSPGTRLTDLPAAVRDHRVLAALVAVTSLAAGTTAGVLLAQHLPGWQGRWPAGYRLAPVPVSSASAGALVAACLAGAALRRASLRGWRDLVVAREQWAPRWAALKVDPAPEPTTVRRLGGATVYDFTRSGPVADLIRNGSRITAQVGGGVSLGYLPLPNDDGKGQRR